MAMLQRRWPRWWFIAAIWTLPGLYFAVQVYLQRSYENHPISIGQAFLRGLIFWMLWAVSSPVILWLARAFPFARRQWSDALLFHLPAGTIFSLGHLLLYVIITMRLGGNPPQSFEEFLAQFQPVFLYSFAWWSLVYWTILVASYAFDFYERYQDGLLRASQLEAQLAQAELQALKMQLHPHFLFNTLHSISALLHEDIETADKMVARLGDFLRMTLHNSGSHEIALEEELKFLECYLAIERLRFQDRLSVEFEIDPAARSASVPNLILQPIVENAIRHGITPLTGPGHLAIRAWPEGDRLRLEVQDNGPGLTTHYRASKGLGLANARARLEGFYGGQHRLDLASPSAGGLVVIIELPLDMTRAEKTYA